MKIITLFLSFLIALFTFTSCDKIKDTEKLINSDPKPAENYVKASTTFTNIFQQTTNALQQKNVLKKINIDSCATVTVSSQSYPKTITLTFNPAGCDPGDGNIYKGTINIVASNPLTTEGATANVGFTDFFVNNNKVTATSVNITSLGREADLLKLRFQVNNGVIQTSDGNITFNTDQTWKWVEGESTEFPAILDDVYSLNPASANGTSTNGKSYNAYVSSTLTVKMNCKTKITGGSVLITSPDNPDVTIDFNANSNCDNKATLKISGLEDKTINL